MGKKAKFLIVFLSLIVVGLVTFIITDKFLLNREDAEESVKKSSKNSVNSTVENVEDNTIENKDNKDENKTNTPLSSKANYGKEVRNALKDKEWLKKNVLVQAEENSMDGEEVVKQVVNFIVCKSNNNKPIIVIQVSAEDIRYSKIVIVTYSESEGKVIAKKINEGHIYHAAYTVDANKCVVNSLYMHGGAEATVYHSIANGELKFIGEYGLNYDYDDNEGEIIKYFIRKTSMEEDPEYVSEEAYNKYKESLKESQYNFVDIGTELNDTNVDRYVK